MGTRTILPTCPAWCIGHPDGGRTPISHATDVTLLGERQNGQMHPVGVRLMTLADAAAPRVQICRFAADLDDDFEIVLPLDKAATAAGLIADGSCTLDALAAVVGTTGQWSSVLAEADTSELADAIRDAIRTATDAPRPAHRAEVEAAVSLLQTDDAEFIVTGAPTYNSDADPQTLTATATVHFGPVAVAFTDPAALAAWARALATAADDFGRVAEDLAAERNIETDKAAH